MEAIEARQFVVYYQASWWKLKTGRLRSAEALVGAWNHPARGTVAAPGLYFVGGQERQIVSYRPLWVLHQAMHGDGLSAGRQRAKRVSIAVKYFALQFRSARGSSMNVLAVLEASGLPPEIAGAGSERRACCFPV